MTLHWTISCRSVDSTVPVPRPGCPYSRPSRSFLWNLYCPILRSGMEFMKLLCPEASSNPSRDRLWSILPRQPWRMSSSVNYIWRCSVGVYLHLTFHIFLGPVTLYRKNLHGYLLSAVDLYQNEVPGATTYCYKAGLWVRLIVHTT